MREKMCSYEHLCVGWGSGENGNVQLNYSVSLGQVRHWGRLGATVKILGTCESV